jgi:thioredoxin-like negative regulator of GroEL
MIRRILDGCTAVAGLLVAAASARRDEVERLGREVAQLRRALARATVERRDAVANADGAAQECATAWGRVDALGEERDAACARVVELLRFERDAASSRSRARLWKALAGRLRERVRVSARERARGGFACVVRSVEEARAAIVRARTGATS